MQINKLRNIIHFNQQNQKKCEELAHLFCMQNDINTYYIDVRNVLRELCEKIDIEILELPIQDKEIGAIFYVQESKRYILLNSNIPRVNLNFAIAHELYHIYVKDSAQNYSVGDIFVIDEYAEHQNEMLANAFAAELLMPKHQINYIHRFFADGKDDFETIIKLMNYFSAPYMSVLIRLLETEKLKDSNIPELINKSQKEIMATAERCGIDIDLLMPSQKDDSKIILQKIIDEGNRLVEREILSEVQLTRTIDNIKRTLKKLNGK